MNLTEWFAEWLMELKINQSFFIIQMFVNQNCEFHSQNIKPE